MRFFDPEFEWIIIGVGCFSLLAGKKIRPGFEITFIKGIALWSHLENDCIEMFTLQEIKKADGFLLLLICAQTGLAWPVNICYCCDPGCPELAGSRGNCVRLAFYNWFRTLAGVKDAKKTNAYNQAL